MVRPDKSTAIRTVLFALAFCLFDGEVIAERYINLPFEEKLEIDNYNDLFWLAG